MVGMLEDIFFSIWSSNKDAATQKGCMMSQTFVLKLLKLQKIQLPALKKKYSAIIFTTFHPQIRKDLTLVHILHMLKTHV